MKPLIYHPATNDDVSDALDWYGSQRIDLAQSFLDELTVGRARIQEYPEAWPATIKGCRRIRLNHYPYKVIYLVRPNKIWIVAIAHDKRRPNYWAKRLKDIG